MDPHSPYYPKQEALDAMGNADMTPARARYLNSYWNRGDVPANRLKRIRKEVTALYDAGVRWIDSQIASLVDTLKEFHLWESCALAVTADHGEEFLDHAGRYHPPSKLTEELIRVPFLLRVPGLVQPGGLQPRTWFSLLHLAPTLLEALNVPAPGSFRGRSHWEKLRKGEPGERPAIVECIAGCSNPFRPDNRLQARVLAIREARFKLVIDFQSSSEALFDLQADPGELRPLAPNQHKAARKLLLENARQHLVESVQSRDAGHRLDARLRDLQLEWAHSNTKISA
jgi:arylsulfatase A-like enzyme